MFSKRRTEDSARAEQIDRRLDAIYTALVIRDPGTSVSADAFEGLRKQVIAASTARRAYLAQLAEFDVALSRGATTEDLSNLVTQWLNEAGMSRVHDSSDRALFDASAPASEPVEVAIPAYVLADTGQLVRQGRLRAVVDGAGAGVGAVAAGAVASAAAETVASAAAVPEADGHASGDEVAVEPTIEEGDK